MTGRQQKRAAKAISRRQAVAAKRQVERRAASPAGRIAAAAAGPVERCLRSAGMAEAGIAYVILARRLSSGLLGCGFFLVDLLCLGVKDAFYQEVAPSELDERLDEMAEDGQPMVSTDPAAAKRLILGAVAFAASCGMDQAGDYPRVMRLFDGIDAAQAAESFVYGRDGRAVYVPGPKDGPAKMRDVERRLVRALGADGAWDIDPVSALSERERVTLQSIVDLMGRRTAGASADEGAGPVIDHEGPTEVRDG